MKKIYVLILFLIIASNLLAQYHGLNYQAVVIDTKQATGIGSQQNYLPETEMIVRFTIYNDKNELIYQEEHVTTSNKQGIINLVIGQGVPTPVCTTIFEGVDMDGIRKNLKVEFCTDKLLRDFVDMSSQELHFVPYAYHRNITASGTMDIEGVTNLNNETNVNKQMETNLSGNLNVEEHTVMELLTVNSTSLLKGQVTITKELQGPSDDDNAYPLIIDSTNQGIIIKINTTKSDDYTFFKFTDIKGTQGMVTGQTKTEKSRSARFVYDNVIFAARAILAGVNIATSSAWLFPTLGLSSFDLAVAIIDAAWVVGEIIAYEIFAMTNVGVAYTSGAGDYAEWLPKIDQTENIGFGEVVGVYGGKVTRKTEGAEQILIVSNSPAALGNIPAENVDENTGLKIGFLGQVPVWVVGAVKTGDYIVAGESGSGLAKAVPHNKLTIEQTNKIIGQALDNNISTGKKLVNTMIGVKTNEIYKFINKSNKSIENAEMEVSKLKNKVNKRNRVLQELIPNYKEELEKQKLLIKAISKN